MADRPIPETRRHGGPSVRAMGAGLIFLLLIGGSLLVLASAAAPPFSPHATGSNRSAAVGSPGFVPASSTALPQWIATIPLPGDPISMTYDPSDGLSYASLQPFGNPIVKLSDNVTILRGTNVTGNLSVGPGPESGVNDPANGYVYLSDPVAQNLSVLSGDSVVATIPLGGTVGAPIFDPDNGYIYVTTLGPGARGLGNLSVVGGTAIVGTLLLGGYPGDLAVDPTNGFVYVSGLESRVVTVVDGTSIVMNVSVNLPGASVYDDQDGWIYVLSGDDSVAAINGTVVVRNFTVGYNPGSLTYAGDTGDIYVTSGTSGNVTVIRGSAVVGTLSPGAAPYTGAYDPYDGYVYIVCAPTAPGRWFNVTLVNGTSVLGSIYVGKDPQTPVYDSGDGYLFVPNFGSANFTVVGVPHASGEKTPPSSGPTVLGLPALDGYVALGGIAVVVIAVVGLASRLRKRRPPAALPPT